MRLPWNKPAPQPRRRGSYKKMTPEQRANELLAKSWYKYLEAHPNYCQEIAKAKFGVPDTTENDGYQPPDLLEQIHNVREAKELFQSELGQKGGTLASIAGIMKELPAILKELPEALKQLGPPQQQYRPTVTTEHITARPEAKRLPEKEPELSPEEALTTMAEKFLEMKAEDAAGELYQYKDAEDDIRGMAYNWLKGKSVEQIIEILPTVQYIPQLQPVVHLADKLASKQGRKWLALVLDEVTRLKNNEKQPN